MANQLTIIVWNIFCGLKTWVNPYMAKSLAKKKLKKLLQADLFCKYSQFWRATLWDQNVNLFFNKTSFTWILARLGLRAPSDTARFELGLQFDLMAAKKIPTNYCELTLHAIFTKLIGSLHNILKIIFFQPNNFYSIIVDAWNKFASKNGHFCG